MRRVVIRLEGLSPQVRGTAWEFDRPLKVGRLPNLDVHLPDSSLSRTHAELIPGDQAWAVRDLGSTNGTYLNGERLGRAEAKLRPGDHIQFGNVSVAVAAIQEVLDGPTGQPAGRTLEATALGSWDDLGLDPTEVVAGQPLLAHLAEFGRSARPADSLEGYLNAVLWKAAETFDAPLGALVFFDEYTGSPRAQVQLHLNGADRDAWPGDALARETVAQGRSLLYQFPAVPGAAGARSVVTALLRVQDRRLGALCLGRLQEQDPFTARDLKLADALALAASPSVVSYAGVQDRQERFLLRTLTVLAQLVRLRDNRTGNHGQRVTDYALLLAEELGLADLDRYHLRIGTSLHDLGKIGIRDAVLDKPGELTADERAHVREQIFKGAELIGQIPPLSALIPIVRNTHERWDGTGYPDALAGEQIPLLARVVAVADAYDAMTTDQPYRRALPIGPALDEIRKRAGTQFDPRCVDAFLRLRGRLEELAVQRRGHTHTLSVTELRKNLQAMGAMARGKG